MERKARQSSLPRGSPAEKKLAAGDIRSVNGILLLKGVHGSLRHHREKRSGLARRHNGKGDQASRKWKEWYI